MKSRNEKCPGPNLTSDPFRFFDVIYCINLDARPDRWREATREFTALGIADRVERVAAIAHPDARESCRLSHLECVRRAAGVGAETALVFEDDVTFPAFTGAALARSLRRLRAIPDWEIFYLGGMLIAPPSESYDDLLHARVAQTHAYALHRRAFAAVQRSRGPFDLWCTENLKSYCTRPILAWQRDGLSDIDGAWRSRAAHARHNYDLWVVAPEREALARSKVLLGVRGRLARRLFLMRARRRLGRLLARVAARGSRTTPS